MPATSVRRFNRETDFFKELISLEPRSCGGCERRRLGTMSRVISIVLFELGTLVAFASSSAQEAGFKFELSGQLRGDAIYSSATQSADALIFYLNPRTPGFDEPQFTTHGKLSSILLTITGPKWGSFETGGRIMVNATGAQPLRNTSGINVLNAFGELKNDAWRFAFGRMWDLFSPISPTTVNGGLQRGAGNTGIYRGALHADRYFNVSPRSRWTLSARISQQDVNDYLVNPVIRGADNGIPNFEARVGAEFGLVSDGLRPLELGLSGLYGKTRAIDPNFFEFENLIFPPLDEVSTTWAAALDLQLRWKHFGVRGEIWQGQAAGTYFVAALQSLNANFGTAIRSAGGWAEVYIKPDEALTFQGGYGLDDPRNVDLGFFFIDGSGQRARSAVAWGNIMYDATRFLQFGFEISYRTTDYLRPGTSNRGTGLHFATTLKY